MRRLAAAFALLAVSADAMGQGTGLPAVDARAYYLMDAVSGAVLAESRAAEPLDPASLTKLMTAYLAFKALAAGEVALDDPVPVSERAWRAPGSRMFIEVGSVVAFDDLLRGLDEWLGKPVFTATTAPALSSSRFPRFDDLYQAIGIVVVDGRVTLSDSAPRAEDRRLIVAPVRRSS